MTPIVATDGHGTKCVIVAFVQGPVHVLAICAYGPLPGGEFFSVPITEFTFDKHPPDWPSYDYWAPESGGRAAKPDPVPA